MSQSILSLQETNETQDADVAMTAHAFAQVLADSPEFRAFEQASDRLRQDNAAQDAILAFQKKQQSLQMMLRLNAVSPQDQAELDRLQVEFLSQPSVAAFLQAQEDLNLLCKAAANQLSERVGLSFSAACRSGCC